MDQEKQGVIKQLRDYLNFIAGCDPSNLAERKELGEMNFQAGKELFQQAVDLAKEFNALPIELLPTQTLRNLVAPATNLSTVLKQIADFKLMGNSNPEATRNSLLTDAKSKYDTAFIAFTPHIPYLSLKSADAQHAMRQATELMKNAERQLTEGVQGMQTKMAEMDSLVKSARSAAGKIGVGHFSTNFEDIAAEHQKWAMWWLIATATLGVATAEIAINFLWWLPPLGDMKDPDTIQRIITKVVVISVAYFSALWSAKNYRAHRHLNIVNKHRQNALTTFEVFVKATDDEAIKNAVLLETTRCIFSPSVTGYLGADEEANPASRVVEILNTVRGAAGQ